MKVARFLFVFLILLSFQVIAPVGDASASQTEFPDLLQDESNDNDVEDPTVKLGIRDPLEPMNRLFFKFNDKLYDWVLTPATNAYIWLLPRDLRDCFGNFFINIASPVTLLNSLLQGDLALTGNVISRFLINSTIGVYGFVDVAANEFNIDLERADFGQTLGVWGMGEGIYLCWPLFGPSSARDSVGLGVDAYLHPVPYFHNDRVLDLAYYTTNKVNTLSLHPDYYEDLRRYALDPYVSSRQAYYEYRKALIERR